MFSLFTVPTKQRKARIFSLFQTPNFLKKKGDMNGPQPQYGGTFRKKFRKNSGKTPETLSERFLEFPSRVRLGCPKPYNSRHLRLPEHFPNCPPPGTAGDASFFRSGSGEGLSEPVMEFPAVLGVSLNEKKNKEFHSTQQGIKEDQGMKR